MLDVGMQLFLIIIPILGASLIFVAIIEAATAATAAICLKFCASSAASKPNASSVVASNLACHVGWCPGSENTRASSTMRRKFEITISKPDTFVGPEIHQSDDEILVNQASYIKAILKEFMLHEAVDANSNGITHKDHQGWFKRFAIERC